MSELCAAVREGNLAYFIDENGEKLGIGEFQWADNFSCGWACINLGGDRITDPEGIVGGNFRYVNVAGEFLDIRLESPSYFSNDRAVITAGSSHYIVDTNGDTIAEGFQNLFPFRDGLAAAVKNSACGYVDASGEWEFQMKPDDVIHSFSGGIAKIERGCLTGFVNQTGQWLLEPQKLKVFDFKERLAIYEENTKYGVVNDSGDKVTDPIFSDMGDFSEGLCAFRQDGLWGFLNSEGEIQISPRFQQVRAFSEGFAATMLRNKVGFIDKTGEFVLPPNYQSAVDFKNGYCIAQKKDKLGYIDRNGSWVIKAEYDRANHMVSPMSDNPYFKAN